MKPRVSVILWSRGDHRPLRNCVTSLLRLHGSDQLEIVCAVHPPPRAKFHFPRAENLKVILVEEAANHAVLRARAMAVATADDLFFTEPYCTFPKNFAQDLLASAKGDRISSGQVVVSDETSLVGWATVFFEFAAFLPPSVLRGTTTNNILVPRRLLEPISQWQATGFWKFFFVQGLAGREKILHDTRTVMHHPPYDFAGFAARCFHHARIFAAMKHARTPLVLRLLRAVLIPVVPWILFARTAAIIRSKRGARKIFLRAAPILFLFDVSWAVGEAVGLLLGPGTSAEKVY